MHCHQAQELLSTYLDGMLVPSEQKKLEEHLQNCPGCQSEMHFLKLVLGLLHNLPQVKPSMGFRRELRQKLLEQKVSSKETGVKNKEKLLTRRWLAITAVAVSILMVVGLATAAWDLPLNDNIKTPQAITVEQKTQNENTSTKKLGSPLAYLQQDVAKESLGTSDNSNGEQQTTRNTGDSPMIMSARNTESVDDQAAIEPLSRSLVSTVSTDESMDIASQPLNPPNTDNRPVKQMVINVKVEDRNIANEQILAIINKFGIKRAEPFGLASDDELIMTIAENDLEGALDSISMVGTIVNQQIEEFDYQSIQSSGLDKEKSEVNNDDKDSIRSMEYTSDEISVKILFQ